MKATQFAPQAQPSTTTRSRKVSIQTTAARSSSSTKATSVHSHGRAGSSSHASIPFPRRLLFPQLPLTSPLPPLFLSTPQDCPGLAELTDESYTFLAMALRGFVTAWWSKITPRDKEFIPLIAHVVTLFVQRLEVRLVDADLSSLIYVDFPTLITQHYHDYRQASSKVGTSYAGGSDASLAQMFHQLQPHMAVSEDGAINETYLRQAVEHVMKACLSPEDYEPEMERSIIREIVVGPVLKTVVSRLTQPWFLHIIFLNLLGPPKARPPEPPSPPPPLPHKRFSFHKTLIYFFKAVQTVSTFCLAAIAFVQHVRQFVHIVNTKPLPRKGKGSETRGLARPPLDMISEVFGMRSRASAGAVLSIFEIGSGFISPFLDRLLPHLLYTYAFTPYRFLILLSQAKKTLFPNGYPGPPTIEPTLAEQRILRESLETRLLEIIPPTLSPILLGTTPQIRQRTITSALDPLSSRECNAHLLILLIDAILLRVFPEIGVVRHAGNDAATEDVETPKSTHIAELGGDSEHESPLSRGNGAESPPL